MITSTLIDKQELAKQLGVKISTLYSWIHQKRIPYVKIGRLVKFDQKDINIWIQSRKIEARNFH